MKKYSFIGLTIFIVVLMTSACKDDIILEPLPTLEGTYNGLYRVITGYNTPQAETTKSTIEMLFSDDAYVFKSDNDPDGFCDPYGNYVLTANNIELTETNDNCTNIARERDNPRGQFNIQRPADSVIMIQQVSDTLKQFLLKKI